MFQVSASRRPPGVVRSPLQPEETRGLTRSGDLSRMLPFEAHLMAAGWPRRPAVHSVDEAMAPATPRTDASTATEVAESIGGASTSYAGTPAQANGSAQRRSGSDRISTLPLDSVESALSDLDLSDDEMAAGDARAEKGSRACRLLFQVRANESGRAAPRGGCITLGGAAHSNMSSQCFSLTFDSARFPNSGPCA